MVARWICRLVVAVLLLVAAGCTRLQRYELVASALPPESLIEVDGRWVHVRRWGAGGRPLVLLHGFGVSSYSFRELGPRLAPGRRVVAIDLNGFGYTERPERADAYSREGQVALVAGVMKRLHLRCADLVGHSYGGDLALRFASSHPDRVRRLVLISPALDMQVGPQAGLRSPALRALLYPLLRWLLSNPDSFHALLATAFHRTEVLNREVSEEFRYQLLVEGLGRAYRGFGDSLAELERRSPGIQAPRHPVLVLAGRHDRIVPLDALRRQLPPEIPLEVLEHSGHSAAEEQPGELARRIREFLR